MQNVEFDLGYNRSNGEFEKYTDDGFSLRATYSDNIKQSEFFRWQGSFQYISFYTNTWSDCIPIGIGENQVCGPTIDITNSERGYTLQGGIRFIPENGFFQSKSIFKPYAVFNIGAIYLQEKTVYSDPDALWFEEEGADYFSLDDIEDYRFNFIYSVELGSNFNFKNIDGFGLDLGIRYNMCPSIKKTENYISDNHPVTVKNRLDADYYTIYIGVTMDLGILQRKNEIINNGTEI